MTGEKFDEEQSEETKRLADIADLNITAADARRSHRKKKETKKKISAPSPKWDAEREDKKEKEAFFGELENLEEEDAIDKIRIKLEKDFDDVDLWIEMGKLYYNISKENEAIHCFKTALIKENENKIALTWLAWCFEELKKWADARDSWKKIIEIDEQNEQALSGLAWNLLKLDDYDSARKNYSKVLEINERDKVALNNIGYTYFLEEKCEEACKWFEKGSHIERENENYYSERYLARCKWKLHCDDECEIIVDKLIEKNTEDDYMYYLKAELLSAKEKYDEAISFLKKSVRINETSNNTFSLGYCYFEKEEFHFAIMYYEQSLKIDGPNKNKIALINLAYCYKNISNLNKALELCDECLEIAPEYYRAIYCKIKCYEQADRYEDVLDAVISFERVAGKEVADVDTLIELIDVCGYLGKKSKALEFADRLLKQAKDENNDNIERRSLNWKAYALRVNEQDDEAITVYDKVIEKWPEYEDAYRLKAQTLYDKGRFEEAIENYRKCIGLLEKNGSNKKESIGEYHLAISKTIKGQGNLLSDTVGYDSSDRRKKMEEALLELDIAEGLLDNDSEVWFEKGNCNWNLRNYPKALQCYETAASINPNRVEIWVCLGDTSQMLDSYVEARYYYEKAVSIGSIDDIWEKEGEIDKNGKNDWLSAKIGFITCLYKEKKYRDALKEIDKVFDLGKKRGSELHRIRGLSYAEEGRYRDAVAVWEMGIKDFPENKWFKGVCLYNASLDSDKAGLELDADEYAKKLIDSDCEISADGYQLQGMYLRQNKHYENAIKLLEEHFIDFSEHGKDQALRTLISCCNKLDLKEKKEEYEKRLKELEEKD